MQKKECRPATDLGLKNMQQEKGCPVEKLALTANILFGGIGCQERGLEDSGVIDLKVLMVSEIDRYAIISRAAIHEGMTPEMMEGFDSYPSEEEMIRELTEKNIGYDPDKRKSFDWKRNGKNRPDFIKKNWLASHLSNNYGDINRIDSLPKADLWTISFPCTDISSGGLRKGLKKGSGTRSSLLWASMHLLEKAVDDGTQPQFLMFENVKDLVGKEFIMDFQKLMDELSGLGYKSRYEILNARECGIPQNRERVFVVCSREDIDMGGFTFPKPFPCDMKLEDIICRDFGKNLPDIKSTKKRNEISERLRKSGIREPDRNRREELGKSWSPGEPDGTETKDMGKKTTNAATKLTPVMCFALMGLTGEDVEKCRAVGMSDTQLFKQAGNGIVTNCVQLIGEHLYKALADSSFVCTDEAYNNRT